MRTDQVPLGANHHAKGSYVARRKYWRIPRSACGSVALAVALLVSCGSGDGRDSQNPDLANQSEIVIAATTDVHGRLRGWDYYTNRADTARSLAAVASILDSVRRAARGPVVLVDAGDLLQGNPLAFVAAKVYPEVLHPVVGVMNAVQYDAAVLGNHEFNYGIPHLRRAIAGATFPFISANIRERNGEPFVPAFTIVARVMPNGDTIHVGIVGGTTPGVMIWDADNARAEGVTVGDIVPAVRQAVFDARQRHADIVVVVLHSGFNERATYDTITTQLPSENVAERVAKEVDGVDVVVFGHSHKEMVDSLVNNVLVVQPRNWAASVALATLHVEKSGGAWKVVSRKGSSVATAGHVEKPAVLAITDSVHGATVRWATAPVGRTNTEWSSANARMVDAPITDFVNEVMRKETGSQLSATSIFSLDAHFARGPISVGQISTLYPYDNTLRAIEISGTQLRAFLEHSARYYRTVSANGVVPTGGLVDSTIPGYNFDVVSGAEYTIDLRQPIGRRITALSVRGQTVQPGDTFTMALNSYRAGGGGGYAMLADAKVVYQRDVDIRQLLIDEVQRVNAIGQTLMPSHYATLNWRIVPVIHTDVTRAPSSLTGKP